MTIDVRAETTCNIGPLISASISDDYIQGSGLIKTTGSCELSGVYTLTPGQQVSFSYSKNGITRKIPRVLRVLSSFADPFRRITSVDLGCKLTYLQDLTDPINWDAFDDPENADRTREETSVVTVPIYAKSIMKKCLEELNITATSIPLTNVFSIAEFDFGSGYVNILSDLLVSESYCGFLNEKEQLVVIGLSDQGGGGPLLQSGSIIDVGPINVGELPGGAVVVSYSTLKLKAPEGSQKEDATPTVGPGGEVVTKWGQDFQNTESISDIAITWEQKNPNGTTTSRYRVYPVLTKSETINSYQLFKVKNEDGTVTRKNLLYKSEKNETRSSIDLAANAASEYFSNGIGFNIFPVTRRTVETFEYNAMGEQTKKIQEVYASSIWDAGSLGINFVFPEEQNGIVSLTNEEFLVEKQIETSIRFNQYEITKTEQYGRWNQTIRGQQAIALAREYITTAQKTREFVNAIYYLGLHLVDESITTNIAGSRSQQAPLPEEINNEKNADGTDPSNGYRTESKAELVLITGSADAQRRIELSMPYASDDIFENQNGQYIAKKSDAKQKARKFGRVQNRMLLGNRYGMNIQTEPASVPTQPFAPFFVEANGVVAMYRANGTSWTIDGSGIIVSVDAMFWGTAGKTT